MLIDILLYVILEYYSCYLGLDIATNLFYPQYLKLQSCIILYIFPKVMMIM